MFCIIEVWLVLRNNSVRLESILSAESISLLCNRLNPSTRIVFVGRLDLIEKRSTWSIDSIDLEVYFYQPQTWVEIGIPQEYFRKVAGDLTVKIVTCGICKLAVLHWEH